MNRNNYRNQDGCWCCVHVGILQDDCWRYFCRMNAHKPPPSEFDWTESMPDSAIARRRLWELENEVNAIGTCDKYRKREGKKKDATHSSTQ